MAELEARKLKVLELYSGIGGMHFALQESEIPVEVVQAVDINPAACLVYKHNFPQTKLTVGLIEGALDVSKLEKLSVDMILMSPPCQPFTRMGKQRDLEDSRTNSFLYLLSLVSRLSNPPRYILVENVKGFETSQVRQTLIDTLQQCQYHYQEFLLTPLQFDIPNSRLRYYLIAKRKPLQFSFNSQTEIFLEIPQTCSRLSKVGHKDSLCSTKVKTKKSENDNCDSQVNELDLKSCERRYSETEDNAANSLFGGCSFHKLSDTTEERIEKESQKIRQQHDEDHKPYPSCHKVEHYLERTSSDFFHSYLLSDSDLKRFVIMDIIPPSARKTACFARRYGNFIEGGGSILMMTQNPQAVKAAADLKAQREEMKQSRKEGWDEVTMAVLRDLQLRWFTPREIANLLYFPHHFSFPEGLTLKQKYKCLGNSLNVRVVSSLIKLMVNTDLPG